MNTVTFRLDKRMLLFSQGSRVTIVVSCAFCARAWHIRRELVCVLVKHWSTYRWTYFQNMALLTALLSHQPSRRAAGNCIQPSEKPEQNVSQENQLQQEYSVIDTSISITLSLRNVPQSVMSLDSILMFLKLVNPNRKSRTKNKKTMP